MSQPSVGRAWAVTFSGTGINLCLGVLYAWSVYALAMQQQWGWTATMTSIPYSICALVFALLMIPAGRMLDKMGPRIVEIIAACCAGAGMIISGVTANFAGVIIGFGILAGAAMGFGYAAPTPTAVKWFQPHMKGQISGLVVAGYGLAAMIWAPVTTRLVKTMGIKQAFIVEGIIFLVVIAALGLVLAPPPPGHVPFGGPPPARATARGVVAQRDFGPGEMVKTFQFWSLLIMFALSASAGLMIIGHLAKISVVQGGIQWGYIFVAILAVANAGGRILAGWLSDRLGRTNTMLLVFTIQAINMFLFSTYKSAGTLLTGSILTGIAYGALLALFPSATWDFFGLKNAGINYGLVFLGWGIGAQLGPIIAGRAIDITKTYHLAYIIAGVLLIVAAVLAVVTKPPKVVAAEEAARA
jgi:MFS family permease